jgi:acetoin utilization deacetylase AcuC-like enzyme
MQTPIIYSERCLGYGNWHIEGPQRVKKAQEILASKGYTFLTPKPACEDDLFLIHDADYIFNVKKGLVEDPDTPAYRDIFDFALLSAGAACLAAEVGGFSLMRPPGHHAGRCGPALDAPTRGFCYLNNIALAVKILNKPTLILDIDGHHGNGTQEIFACDPKVTYLSLHRHPFYPGTGCLTENNYINFCLPADCGEKIYLQTFDSAIKMVNWSKYEVLAVSAGFDTHMDDLASLGLTEQTYRRIGNRIGVLGKRTFFVFEGGYRGECNGVDIDQLLIGYEEKKA